MMKKARINLEQTIEAIDIYEEISMEVVEINLRDAIRLASRHNIYAYDAYILQCSIEHNIPLISLDQNLINIAKKEGVQVIEV